MTISIELTKKSKELLYKSIKDFSSELQNSYIHHPCIYKENRVFLNVFKRISLDSQILKDLLLSLGLKEKLANKPSYQNILNIILGNVHNFDTNKFLTFSRRRPFYTEKFNIKPSWFTLNNIVAIIELLKSKRLVEEISFSNAKRYKQNKGIGACLIINKSFIKLVSDLKQKYNWKFIKVTDFELQESRPSIEDTGSSAPITGLTFGNRIDLGLPNHDYITFDGEYLGSSNHFRTKKTKRVFNSCYSLTKEQKIELDLDDPEGNIDLDFSSCHIQLSSLSNQGNVLISVYEDIVQWLLESRPSIEDTGSSAPITGLTFGNYTKDQMFANKEIRDAIKSLLTIALQTTTPRTCIEAYFRNVTKDKIDSPITKEEAKQILVYTTKTYPSVSWYKKEINKKALFDYEGDIMLLIIEKLNHHNIKYLDQFDGITVGKKNKSIAKQIMIEAFQQIMNTTLIPPIKEKQLPSSITQTEQPLEAPISHLEATETLKGYEGSSNVIESILEANKKQEQHAKKFRRRIEEDEIEKFNQLEEMFDFG